MPIYEYACPDCGNKNDHLQKLADAPIAACPKCGSSSTYYKKISAAGFALKGTGWYVTDFRNGNTGQKSDDKKAPEGTNVPPASVNLMRVFHSMTMEMDCMKLNQFK